MNPARTSSSPSSGAAFVAGPCSRSLVDAATFAPRLVVELDDASRERADCRDRDALVDDVLAAAGIPILHVRWRRRYDTHVLAGQIAEKIGIAAPALVPTVVPAPQPTPAVSSAAPALVAVPYQPAVHAPTHGPVVVATTVAPAPAAPSGRACGQCQAELREGTKFCAQCGAVFALAQ